jgi:hypothetical protein
MAEGNVNVCFEGNKTRVLIWQACLPTLTPNVDVQSKSGHVAPASSLLDRLESTHSYLD